MFHFLTPFLLLVSWLLSLLISLSVPIFQTIFLWDLKLHSSTSVTSANVTGDVKFGLWGYCVSLSDSTHVQCTRASLGLHVDPTLAQLLGIKSFENTINRTTTSVLALHPVTCVLAFLALLIAMHAAWRPSRPAHFFTLIMSSISALAGTIVLFIDIAVVAISEKKLKNATSNTLDITWGNAVWMSLGTIIGLWAACAGAFFAICACGGSYSRRRNAYDVL
ncbi:pali-domain-containing protein [Gautieria morchelliformis]|nr:pali-domain-containing protein [Gautieria morchelliformis]